ncbi:pre-mRNA-processing factor 40, putative [Plasmodium sp. gorilla clade G1]|nr:pre-mRNA-processing factor 40, putative [Plasmodium sp. gorilla clade G1]
MIPNMPNIPISSDIENVPNEQNITNETNITNGEYVSSGPNVSGGPNMPGGSNMPGGPNMPGGSNMPGGPNIPGGPSPPSIPQIPNLPTIPGMPNILNLPNLPNLSNFPNFPGLPNIPNLSGIVPHNINNSHFMSANPMNPIGMPFMPGLLPNMNTCDYYHKNLMPMHPGYDNYNNIMYGQPNNLGMPIPPNNMENINDMATNNPNMIKIYNKDSIANNSQKMMNTHLMNLHNNVNANYMNNYNMEKHGWVEMVAKNGRKFYYNSITKCSKWEKPNELKTKEEIRISEKTKWKEYSCSDGRKYWYHEEKNISVWDEPEEIKKIKLECALEDKELENKDDNKKENIKDEEDPEAETNDKSNASNNICDDMYNSNGEYKMNEKNKNIPFNNSSTNYVNVNNIEQINKKIDNNNNNNKSSLTWEKFDNKNDAREHLKFLFEEKKVNPKMTWDSALKILEADNRWSSLVILTKGEKKQLFCEYISHVIKRNNENERRKRQKSREIIFQTLLNWDKLNECTTYVEFASQFYKQEWWEWITEKERDEVFQDFMDDYKSKFKETRRKKRKQKMEILKQKFQEYATDNKNPLKWNDVQKYFRDDEDFHSLHKIDALAAWEDFYEKYHNVEKMKLKKKIYRILRKKREAFIELLNEYYENNILNMKTQWIFFVSKIYKDTRYTDILGHQGSSPRILFDEFIDSLQEQYLIHKSYIKKAYKEMDFTIDENITLEDFLKTFSNVQSKYNIPDANMNFIYLSLQKKLKQKKNKEIKHINKVAKYFSKFTELKPSMSYNKVISIMKNTSKWSVVCTLCPKEEQKLAAYNMWKTFINSQDLDNSSDSSYSNKMYNKNSRKKDISNSKEHEYYDDEDKTTSRNNKYLRDDESDSSAQTIESLRTIENASS